jgi:hypothetical protein
MRDNEEREDKPVEIFCPICGFTTPVNQVDEKYATLTREEKVSYVKMLQKSDHPVFTCGKCDNPGQSADIMEVR